MKNKKLSSTLRISCLTILIIVFWYIISQSTTLPDVHVSHKTGKCTKVVNYGTNYSCDNLPEKYIHVWVK